MQNIFKKKERGSKSGRTNGVTSRIYGNNDKPPLGVSILKDPQGAVADVVFIHGLGGHREDTWRAPIAQNPWPESLLTESLPCARIVSYGYDSRVTDWTHMVSRNTITDHADAFLRDLANLRDGDDTNDRPIVFVAHSLGGLVCEDALVRSRHHPDEHAQKLSACTRGIVFMGTPHAGVDQLVEWARLLALSLGVLKQTNTEILQVLRRDSELLYRIQNEFHTMIRDKKKRGETDIELCCFFEELPLRGIGLVVPKESAYLPGYNISGIHYNHRDMTRLNDGTEAGQQAILAIAAELRRWLQRCPSGQALAGRAHGANTDAGRFSSSCRDTIASSFDSRDSRPFSGIPYPRNLELVGCANVLDKIHSHMRIMRCVTLCGIGGVGKTEIAIEYCYQLAYSHPSSLIFWIPCETIAKIDAAFVDVARSLRLPGHDDPYTNKTALVCHYLLQQVHPSWLLVMDNADDEDCLKQGEFPLARFVSNLSTGSVLVTTRYRGVASLLTGGKASKGILVPQLPPDDALELFRSKLPVLSETDVPIGLRIVAILEYLPLCITQAAAYIDQCETSLQDYHAELEASDASLMQSLKEDYPDARRGFEAPNSILKTWKASFEKIRTRSKQASHLLAIMGFLDRQDINRDLLRNIFDTPAQLNQALGILRGFCLILDGPSQASYRMHRLVQLAIRFWLSEKLIEFEAVAFKLIYDTFCTITGDTTRQQRLVPHARLVETYTSLPGTYDLELATLRHCIALHDYDIGQYSAALKHCKEAYLQRSRLLGDAHISTLHSKGYMAVIMREQRQFADACVLQQEVLNVKKALLGTDDLDTVDTMHDLASVLERNGDDEKSYSLAAKALQARQRQLGVSDPKTLQSSMLVALLLRKRGDYQESEKLYREALDSFEKILPQNHESTLNCTASLAELLRERGCYDEALQLSSRVFKGKEETLGPEHPRTLLVKNNFALCCHRCGRTEEAETLLRSICITHERFGRHDHADALQAYSNLSIMLCDLQKYDESVELTRRALEGRTKAFGFEHRDTVSTAAELAFTLCKMRRYEEAEILANQVIRIRQRTLGEQHALTLNTLTTLARIMKNTGRVDEALVVFGIILDGRKKIFGAKHPLTREICGELASLPE